MVLLRLRLFRLPEGSVLCDLGHAAAEWGQQEPSGPSYVLTLILHAQYVVSRTTLTGTW